MKDVTISVPRQLCTAAIAAAGGCPDSEVGHLVDWGFKSLLIPVPRSEASVAPATGCGSANNAANRNCLTAVAIGVRNVNGHGVIEKFPVFIYGRSTSGGTLSVIATSSDELIREVIISANFPSSTGFSGIDGGKIGGLGPLTQIGLPELVPEPSSLLLLGMGMAGLITGRIRRRLSGIRKL